ncbi:translation initiation factor IF-2 [Sulfuriroseicoccus oceanibius]|uniref:Translation initiation factor IF-2 n=1 Tax=Sulfuriroseicoccus oceanibius TaxID=2707525 RepID=A0A6B3L266_9BACT|nr:translation initiation factor IF-2 [Sulfuriroseicoccus oceanibius]QQL44176.1 translation initiation factor IF-2 [Sulfuriroseicoccus oceanibius]
MPEESNGSEKPKKKEVLDLLEDKSKIASRRQRRRAQLEQEEAAEEERKRNSVEEQKKNALDLFSDDKPKKKRGGAARKANVLPPISKLKEEEAKKAEAASSSDTLAAVLASAGIAPGAEKKTDEPAEKDAPAPAAEKAAEVAPVEESAAAGDEKLISLKPPVVIKDLAAAMGLKPLYLIKDLMEMDVFANPDQSIEPDVAAKLCEKHGFAFEREKREKGGGVHKVEEVIEEPEAPKEEPKEQLHLRAPIITFMGHVDHGKTSLIDRIRDAKVVAGEAGGITQHIGAYSVDHNGSKITFLDTPGHAIFTEMRARGAGVTDIVVLVVAADDGIMPQTEEAINHAKAAGVEIIVAINKMDLPAANPDRIKAQLQERDLSPEDWGGTTICVPVSAQTGEGIDELLDMMALQAEVLELQANPKANARATVIEARLEQGRGATATVIVDSGTLRPGMPFICGPYNGKIKSLINDRGEKVKEAGPAMPVEVLGFSETPHVGDELVEMKSDRDAKKLSAERLEEARRQKLESPKRTRLEDIFSNIQDTSQKKRLKVLLKGDVQGSVEAICNALGDIKSDKIDLDIIHSGAGPISENDVLLASASDAIVLGFSTKLESSAVRVAKREGVQVKIFSIVYELIDQVKDAMLGMLDQETRENVVGHAEVKQVFKSKKGKAAGCLVIDGKMDRTGHARLLRDGMVVYDGDLGTLRRFQDDVKEVKTGVECGIRLGDYNDYEVGDIIECYHLEKLKQSL